jgi:hypothetical protein
MKAGRRHEGAEPGDEVQGMQNDAFRAIAPCGLEAVVHSPVLEKFKPLGTNRRSGHVTNKALEPTPIAPVDCRAGVDIDAPALGHGHRNAVGIPGGSEAFGGSPARLGTQQLQIARRCRVARGQGLLLGCQFLTQAPVPRKHAGQPRVDPPG